MFTTTAVEPGSNKKTAVTITEDEPLLDVADALKESGVIDNKYAFILKVRINGDAGKIKPGTYPMSPSNTNQEIIDMITGVSGDASSGSADSSSTGDESGGDSQDAAAAVTNATGTGDEGAVEDRTTAEDATESEDAAGDMADGETDGE